MQIRISLTGPGRSRRSTESRHEFLWPALLSGVVVLNSSGLEASAVSLGLAIAGAIAASWLFRAATEKRPAAHSTWALLLLLGLALWLTPLWFVARATTMAPFVLLLGGLHVLLSTWLRFRFPSATTPSPVDHRALTALLDTMRTERERLRIGELTKASYLKLLDGAERQILRQGAPPSDKAFRGAVAMLRKDPTFGALLLQPLEAQDAANSLLSDQRREYRESLERRAAALRKRSMTDARAAARLVEIERELSRTL